jgi:prophage maintenance system killer protein
MKKKNLEKRVDEILRAILNNCAKMGEVNDSTLLRKALRRLVNKTFNEGDRGGWPQPIRRNNKNV